MCIGLHVRREPLRSWLSHDRTLNRRKPACVIHFDLRATANILQVYSIVLWPRRPERCHCMRPAIVIKTTQSLCIQSLSKVSKPPPARSVSRYGLRSSVLAPYPRRLRRSVLHLLFRALERPWRTTCRSRQQSLTTDIAVFID